MINKRNGRWRVKVTHHGRVVADRTFRLKSDAQTWEREQRRQLELGTWIDPRRSKATVEDLAESWLAHRRLTVAQRTWESDESAMRLHVRPALGRRPVGSISRAEISRFLATLSQGRSRATVARVGASFSAFLAYLVEDGYLRVNPAAGVKTPAPDRVDVQTEEVNPFSVTELVEVVEEQRRLSPLYADVTLVLGLTGLRFGELRGLVVADVVDVPYPAIRVRRSVPSSKGGGAPIVRGQTKTNRPRVVPLPELVQPVISRWTAGKHSAERVFTAPQGGWLSLSNWRRSVSWSKTGRGRRPYDLRHTAATAWLEAGIDVKTVQTWLGHASAELTLNLYGHHRGTDADRAGMARMNAFLSDASSDPSKADHLDQ